MLPRNEHPAPVCIRAAQAGEDAWIESYLRQSWGSATVVSIGSALLVGVLEEAFGAASGVCG